MKLTSAKEVSVYADTKVISVELTNAGNWAKTAAEYPVKATDASTSASWTVQNVAIDGAVMTFDIVVANSVNDTALNLSWK